MTRHRVAIYAPGSRGMYERTPIRVGGAERQMTLLARSVAAAGLPVAHIIFPPEDPVADPDGPTIVPRAAYAGQTGASTRLSEALSIWRGLHAADADVYVVRGSSPALGVAALYCRTRRRRLIFSSANDVDFTLDHVSDRRHRLAMYRAGLRAADAVVVQSAQQIELARRGVEGLRRVVQIPSFGEGIDGIPTTPQRPERFLWIGRLIDYKQPLQYLELARQLPEARFWMLGVVGWDTSDYPDQIRRAAAEIPNLEMLDPRPHGEAMELMSRSVAVVSTSRLEGMPNIFLEAWARGVPVLSLSFDPDGLLAQHGLGIAGEGDWHRFVEAARDLWRDDGDRNGLARRAQEYVAETHSPDAVGRRWVSLVDELLSPASRVRTAG